jgi:hypothetical protein
MPHREMPCSRRDFLTRAGGGLGLLALFSLLEREGGAAEGTAGNLLAAHKPHFKPMAKSVIWCFLDGGPSHIDLFDPKLELQKLDGKPLPGSFTRPVTSMGKTAYTPLLGANSRSTASRACGSATGIRRLPPAPTTSRSSAAAGPTGSITSAASAR